VGGTHWEEVLNAQEFFHTTEKVYVHWIEVAPSDASVVYALPSIKFYHHGILLVSTDAGNTWAASSSVVDGRGACLAVDPHDARTLYVGTWYRGVYRSRDGGATWQAINDGLPTTSAPFLAVAVDPSNPQRIYLGVEGSVYYSANRGDQWRQLAQALTTDYYVTNIAIDPQDPRNVYATTGWDGAFRLLGWDPEEATSAGELQRMEDGP
jgi:photosystem II stability/assembly factor-like uncharacterized protein